jgi:hypothetical protein
MFLRAEVTDQFKAQKAQFNDKETGANFEGLTASSVNVEDTVFEGPVRFYGLTVAGNFEANRARFNDTTIGATFERLAVNGYALLHDAVFAGPARFYRTTVTDNFQTNNAKFNGDVDFSGMRANAVGFLGASFQRQVFMDDMSYEHITERGEGANKLREMIHTAASSIGAHAALQEYHQRRGDLSSADAIYIDQRRSETKKLPWGVRWFASRFFDCFFGYGRKLWRGGLFWTAVFVVAGSFIFRSKKIMQPLRAEDEARPYCAFLYSLDLFLPIIDLQAVSTWRPRPEQRLALSYSPVHIIFGWILATVLVAALTGIFK